VEVDPLTGVMRTVHAESDKGRFFTRVRGKHQRLDNGNTLIVESLAGRVFEVTPAGRTVWEFINRYDADHVARINDAVRYPADYFTVTDWECG
jgi:hypothetical protein